MKILPRAPQQATDQLSAEYERTRFANAVTKVCITFCIPALVLFFLLALLICNSHLFLVNMLGSYVAY